MLLTRRALAKPTWPGVWTNTCCGHPRPDEPIPAAIARRLDHELGMAVDGLECVLPDFAYRATDVSGIVENEVLPGLSCPGRASGRPSASESRRGAGLEVGGMAGRDRGGSADAVRLQPLGRAANGPAGATALSRTAR